MSKTGVFDALGFSADFQNPPPAPIGALAAVEPRPGSQGAVNFLLSGGSFPVLFDDDPRWDAVSFTVSLFHLEFVKRVSKKAHHETVFGSFRQFLPLFRSMLFQFHLVLGLLYIIVGGEGATNFPRDELHIGFKKLLIELLHCKTWTETPTKTSEKSHHEKSFTTRSFLPCVCQNWNPEHGGFSFFSSVFILSRCPFSSWNVVLFRKYVFGTFRHLRFSFGYLCLKFVQQ